MLGLRAATQLSTNNRSGTWLSVPTSAWMLRTSPSWKPVKGLSALQSSARQRGRDKGWGRGSGCPQAPVGPEPRLSPTAGALVFAMGWVGWGPGTLSSPALGKGWKIPIHRSGWLPPTVHEAQGEHQPLLCQQRGAEGNPGGPDGVTAHILLPGQGPPCIRMRPCVGPQGLGWGGTRTGSPYLG